MTQISNQEQPKEDKKPQVAQRSHSLPIIFSSIALISAITALLFIIYQTIHLESRQHELKNVLIHQHDNQFERMQRVDGLHQEMEVLNTQQKKQSEAIKLINKQIEDIRQTKNVESNSLLLIEFFHLIQLADLHSHYDDNVVATIKLLQLAGRRLQHITNLNVTQMHKAITKDILSLQNLPLIDVSNILQRLEAIKILLPKLSLAMPQLPQFSPQSSSKSSNWYAALWDSWQRLQSLITVRRVDQTVKPLMTTQQQEWLSQNLTWMLTEAQLAALNREEIVFRDILKQLETLIKSYYQIDIASTKTLLSELENLQQLPIKQPPFNLNETLDAVQRWQEQHQMQKSQLINDADSAL